MNNEEKRPNPVGSTSDFLPRSYLAKNDVDDFVNRFKTLNPKMEIRTEPLAIILHYPRSKKGRLYRGGNF